MKTKYSRCHQLVCCFTALCVLETFGHRIWCFVVSTKTEVERSMLKRNRSRESVVFVVCESELISSEQKCTPPISQTVHHKRSNKSNYQIDSHVKLKHMFQRWQIFIVCYLLVNTIHHIKTLQSSHTSNTYTISHNFYQIRHWHSILIHRNLSCIIQHLQIYQHLV